MNYPFRILFLQVVYKTMSYKNIWNGRVIVVVVVICLSGAPPAAVLRRSDPLLLSEHAAEVLRILESEAVGHLRDAFAGGESVLGKLDHEPADVVAGRISGRLFDDVAEVVGRKTQPIGAVLDGGQSEGQLEPLLVIVGKQLVEADQNVGIFDPAGLELAVVEALAEVEHQSDVAD